MDKKTVKIQKGGDTAMIIRNENNNGIFPEMKICTEPDPSLLPLPFFQALKNLGNEKCRMNYVLLSATLGWVGANEFYIGHKTYGIFLAGLAFLAGLGTVVFLVWGWIQGFSWGSPLILLSCGCFVVLAVLWLSGQIKAFIWLLSSDEKFNEAILQPDNRNQRS